MSHRCVEPIELAALLELPPDAPRRLEAAGCPRCDSLLRAMSVFLDGDAGLPDGDRAQAERHLAGVLAGAMAGPEGRPVEAATPTARRRAARRPQRGQGWGLGLAAAAAGVMFLVARDPVAPTGPSGVLRGGAPSVSVAADLTVTVTAGDREGRVLLAWPAVPGADHYLVELFTADLDTLGVYGPLSEPALAVDSASLRANPEGRFPAAVLCRVRARDGAGEVAVSRLVHLKLP
jgi:hypothetical protein